MLKIIISGCNGFMGKAVAAVAADDPNVCVIAGVDIESSRLDSFPVYVSLNECEEEADVVIDFSNPAALEGLLCFAEKRNIPLVLCTTGYSAEQLSLIEKASEHTPMFRSGNMSLGINLLSDLVKRACAVLGDSFDVEIVERHHRRKVDAPSGTAVMLAEAAASALPYDANYVYERESVRKPRTTTEIGISAIRGGSIVGDHEVIFAGPHEVIELKHSAGSRELFASGAVKAAKFITGVKKAGMYNMSDVLAEHN